jgi:hypothetical protein
VAHEPGSSVDCQPGRLWRRSALLIPRRNTTFGSRHPRKSRIKNSIQIGKYLVSPLIKTLADGRFAPSVSIRSGRGSATHDRVMRLVRVFDTHRAARRHAVEQGLLALGMPAALQPMQP